MTTHVSLLVAGLVALAEGQPPSPQSGPAVLLRDALPVRFPGAQVGEDHFECDCNSPLHWDGDTLYVFNSAGHPWRCSGPDLFHLDQDHRRVEYNNQANGGRWIESTWKDDDGTLYGWYHNEPGGICPERTDFFITAPRIGAVRSHDNGLTWEDLGIVLEADPATLHCDTANRYFAGGNGDFSVILDRQKEWFYFLISTYGDFAEQGVAVARMRYADRNEPVGRVWKWHAGAWNEPGLGGHLTPIFPAKTDWHHRDADAFWGPSIHWNTHLQQYVVILNRAIDWEWRQEGLYISVNPDLADPMGWTPPRKIMEATGPVGWYPEIVGIEKGGTDKLAGKVARLFIRGESRWEIVF